VKPAPVAASPAAGGAQTGCEPPYRGEKMGQATDNNQKNSIFAAAMSGTDALKVDLRQALHRESPLVISVDDSFFAALEQEEILGGEVVAQVGVQEKADGVFLLTLTVKGRVKVACDRCLEEVTLPVEASETVKVCRDGAEGALAGADDERRTLPGPADLYDVAWDLYETVALALPLRRVHEDGACNPEMLRYMDGESAGEDEM